MSQPLTREDIVSRIQANCLPEFPVAPEMLEKCTYVTDDVEVFRQHYKGSAIDFVYDAKSKIFFIGLKRLISHERFMGTLYRCYTGNMVMTDWDAADAYVDEQHGFFRSSAGPVVWCSPDFSMPPELKQFLRMDVRHP